MNLSSQVTSLELSKRLRELGVRSESLFSYHCIMCWDKNEFHYEIILMQTIEDRWMRYSAFTASELFELLPDKVDLFKVNSDNYYCRYIFKTELHECLGENLCNSLAKMLIKLIENKLLEIK